MMDNRSPIEMLIDRACGVTESKSPGVFMKWMEAQGKTIVLECSMCGTTKVAVRDKTDPQAAVKAVFPCPKCWPHGTDKCELKFYDKDGNAVSASWEAEG